MFAGFILRTLRYVVCFLALCSILVADDKLTIKKLRSLEHQLVSTEKSLDAYRTFLTQSSISKQDREIAEARIRDLESLAKQGVWIIGGKKLLPQDLKANFARSEALIADAIKLAESKANSDAQKKMSEASKLNRASFHADFLMGLYAASVNKDFSLARQHFEECVQRGRALRAVWGPVGETNYLHAVNNMALTKVREDKLDEAYKLWSESLEIRPNLPAEIVHNIARTLRYMEVAKGGPVLKISEATLKKFGGIVETIGGKSTSGLAKNGWVYLGFLPGQTIGDNIESSFSVGPNAGLGSIFSSEVVDDACLQCDGRTKIPCDGGCNKGAVTVDGFDFVPDQFGGKRVPKSYEKRCNRCGGNSVIDCPACSDGSEDVNFGLSRSRK